MAGTARIPNTYYTVSKGDLAAIFCFQTAIEIAYYFLGVRINIFPLFDYVQIVDPLYLQTDLLRSLLFLHIQPPGFNLFLGLVLKLFPHLYPMAFQGIFFVLAILLLFVLFALQVRFGVSRHVAFLVTGLLGASPDFILYEHHLFYTFGIASLWLLSVLELHRFLRSRRLKNLVVFYLILAVLAWTRSLIHLTYCIAVSVYVLWITRPTSKGRLAATLIMLAVVMAPYVKNWVVFGKFTQSTLFPGNIAKVTTVPLGQATRDRLYEEGRISRYSWHLGLSPPSCSDADDCLAASDGSLWTNPDFLNPYRRFKDVPILFKTFRPTVFNQAAIPNINHAALIGMHDIILKDDIYLATHYPGTVLLSWFYSSIYYSLAAYDQSYLSIQNKAAARPAISVWDRLYLKTPAPFLDKVATWASEHFDYHPIKKPDHLFLTLLIGLPLLFLFGIGLAWRMPKCPDRHALWYLTFSIGFASIIGNTLDCGENNRFRFMIDPMYMFLFGLALQRLLDWAAVHFTWVTKKR
ncbi:MAG: hypothetical protein GXP54_02080 [Deltaproteobacteria bacterium]|nr:hypothetical protein [Deltaproteobacteria bacterium]